MVQSLYHNGPKFLERQVWANSVEEQSDQGRLFAILSTSFQHITLC